MVRRETLTGCALSIEHLIRPFDQLFIQQECHQHNLHLNRPVYPQYNRLHNHLPNHHHCLHLNHLVNPLRLLPLRCQRGHLDPPHSPLEDHLLNHLHSHLQRPHISHRLVCLLRVFHRAVPLVAPTLRLFLHLHRVLHCPRLPSDQRGNQLKYRLHCRLECLVICQQCILHQHHL